ncbi:phosphotransferase family protein [Patulibacter sp.]|uniref:phosphotransferase family protein n=1 Tax=Patulibacter sp. TaxID=1912859 RepID=UPI0027221A92|nr:phosphotransferase family protein [Patulibacter sp.]MDO9407824.1 phosphotransferase family protein [Patulibacter sp.]
MSWEPGGEVTAWLLGLGLGVAPPVRYDRMAGGRSNMLFLVTDADGRRWVLRRPPEGELLASAHDVVREHRILSGLAAVGFPAPAPLGLCTDEAVAPVPLLLLEHVDGVAIDGPDAAEAQPPAWRGAAATALAATLAAVHAVDLEVAGLRELAARTSYGERQLRRWRRQWAATRTRELPRVEALADRLEARIPAFVEPVLVHGDYHLRNVLFAAEDGRVATVLDWELCTLGDPMADVGALLAYWPQPGDDGPQPNPTALVDGFPDRAAMADAYAAASGRVLDELAFWESLACWKVAIILEGVLRREVDAGIETPGRAAMIDAMLLRAERALDAGAGG